MCGELKEGALVENSARAGERHEEARRFAGPPLRIHVFLLSIAALLIAGACCEATSYRLPYPCGASYVVTQGNNSSTSHTGKSRYAIDFGMPEGRQVVAAAAGTVMIVEDGFTKGGNDKSLMNYANRIVIEHDDGYCSLYLHLQHDSAVVVEGQRVSQGQAIARSGRTGYVVGATGAHLHFQLQRKGIWWEQSVPVSFDDVPGGIPQEGRSYVSGNCRGARTATVLVMDTSGSMGYRWQGGVKIESAKEAALQFIHHVEQENLTQGTEHWIGVIGFSSDAHLILPLTNNYARARSAVISLHATNATNLGAGLMLGLEQVSDLGGEVQRYVTILSDGNTNTGLSKDEILSGPVAQARRAKICLNTVAFGDRNDVDESFLRRIASPLVGCGRYEYAATGFDLFAAYIKIRHHALGQVISGLSSFGRSVTPLTGRTIPLGTVSIPSGQQELQITLGWSERGTLQLKLYDPTGRQVTSSYPGARVYSAGQFAQAIVSSPQTGIWRVEALPLTSMPQGTQYFAIGSTRPGGIAFALPLPVFTIGDRTFALPGNMPTWALVLVSVVCIAVGLWQLLSDAGLL